MEEWWVWAIFVSLYVYTTVVFTIKIKRSQDRLLEKEKKIRDIEAKLEKLEELVKDYNKES